MTKPFSGGCACGAIRYTAAAEPIMANDCQCRQCQKDSGTGHGSYLTFPMSAATLSGEPKSFDFIGDLGTVKRRAFCPTCGTPVYMTFPAMPDILVVQGRYARRTRALPPADGVLGRGGAGLGQAGPCGAGDPPHAAGWLEGRSPTVEVTSVICRLPDRGPAPIRLVHLWSPSRLHPRNSNLRCPTPGTHATRSGVSG